MQNAFRLYCFGLLYLFLANLKNLTCENRIKIMIIQLFDFEISHTVAEIFLSNSLVHPLTSLTALYAYTYTVFGDRELSTIKIYTTLKRSG